MMNDYTVTVLMWVHDGQMATFEAYERAVKPLIEAHGGRFVKVYRPTLTIGTDDTPDEVHVLAFGCESDLQNYLKSPKPASTMALRTAIRKTIIFGGENEL